jgi:tRNA pseudouridine32 synthase/23S rRNA pseudouridine746 synthase
VLTPEASPDYTRPLQLLAQAIAFTDPISGHAQGFESLQTLKPLAEVQARYASDALAGSPT